MLARIKRYFSPGTRAQRTRLRLRNGESFGIDGGRNRPVRSEAEHRTDAALISAMQASPHKEIEIEASRGPMHVRDVSL